jgi:hypothetical protein
MSDTPDLIAQSERQRCEVWTRVMGYHRPVSQWNPGKRSEHAERRFFRQPADHFAARFGVTV